MVECQNPDVRFVTLEEDGMSPGWRHPKNFAAIAGCNIEIAGGVEREVPDVFGFRIKIDGSRISVREMVLTRTILRQLGRVGPVLDAVDLSVRICCCINDALPIDYH